jgi:hypothetical protein
MKPRGAALMLENINVALLLRGMSTTPPHIITNSITTHGDLGKGF